MAILGRSLDQRAFPLVGAQQIEPGRFLESHQDRKLLVDPARHRRILRRSLGTCLALALPAQTNQGDQDKCDVPCHLHWLHGQ